MVGDVPLVVVKIVSQTMPVIKTTLRRIAPPHVGMRMRFAISDAGTQDLTCVKGQSPDQDWDSMARRFYAPVVDFAQLS